MALQQTGLHLRRVVNMMRLCMKSPLLFTLLLATTSAFAATAPKVTPADAAKLVAAGKAVLVDCREPAEWKETGVAAPAVLLPKSDFDGNQKQWREFLAQNKDKQVIIYCRSGRRSGLIANALAAEGVQAANAGALTEWSGAGLPVRKADEPRAKK
jgi:rhodanese-related sulfurtransferase